LGALALNIRHIAIFAATVTYNPVMEICTAGNAHRSLIDAIGVFVVDTVLLLTMLIGLLRCGNENSAGIWKLLYQQCIIWLALAFSAEIPPLVFVFLNLNDVWNGILLEPR